LDVFREMQNADVGSSEHDEVASYSFNCFRPFRTIPFYMTTVWTISQTDKRVMH